MVPVPSPIQMQRPPKKRRWGRTAFQGLEMVGWSGPQNLDGNSEKRSSTIPIYRGFMRFMLREHAGSEGQAMGKPPGSCHRPGPMACRASLRSSPPS
jgi:hypothetical protein